MFAARALCRIGPEGRAEALVVVPALITQLATGKTPRDRAWAAEVINAIGPPAAEAIPALEAAAYGNDQDVRGAARAALEAVKRAPIDNDRDPQTPRNP